MTRSQAIVMCTAVILAFTFIGAWSFALCSGFSWTLRIAILKNWGVFVGLGCLALVFFYLKFRFLGRDNYEKAKVYRKLIPVPPRTDSRNEASPSLVLFQTTSEVMIVLGLLLAIPSLKLLYESIQRGEMTGPSSWPAWIFLGFTCLLPLLSYSVTLEEAGTHLCQNFSLGKLTYTRVKRFSENAFPRLRERIWLMGTERRYKNVRYSFLSLEIVDGSEVTVLKTEADSYLAKQVATFAQQPHYEHFTVNYMDENPPVDTEPVENQSKERVRDVLTPAVLLFVILALAFPWSILASMAEERGQIASSAEASRELYERERELQALVKPPIAWDIIEPLSDEEKRLHLEGLSAWDQMLEEYPDTSKYYLYRGLIYLRLEKFEQGIADIDRFRELDPEKWNLMGRWNHESYPLPYKVLIQGYRKTGNPKTAMWIFRKKEYQIDEALRALILLELGRSEDAKEIWEEQQSRKRSWSDSKEETVNELRAALLEKGLIEQEEL